MSTCCQPHTVLLPALLATMLSACAADRPLEITLGPEITRPERAAVVFFIDGLGRRSFDAALAGGRLPNISRHLVKRGVIVDRAVTCVPSITYAVSVSLLTGCGPGRHGVVSNKYLDPESGRFRNYCYIKTYQQVDLDYRSAPTLYERLPHRVTVSIQAAMRRGCTHTIDNWATSGINWFFGNKTGADCLVAQAFELIGRRSSGWGQWPDLIWAYFPATDAMGHLYGPDSLQYLAALANADRQIGHICDALQAIGMYDRTTLCLVSDHGMVAVRPDGLFDIAGHIKAAAGLARVWHDLPTTRADQSRLLAEYDLAIAVTAGRWAAVYPLAARRGADDETANCSAALLERERSATQTGTVELGTAACLPTWAATVLAQPAVEMLACSFRPGAVHLFCRDRYALILRIREPAERHAVLQPAAGGVFTPAELPDPPPQVGPSDRRWWMEATAADRYPSLVPQIVAMFDTPRAGHFVFFAAEGYRFADEDPAGGHGSIMAEDMLVPMVFAGPGVPTGTNIRFSCAYDLAPTLLRLLGGDTDAAAGDPVDMDGRVLLP